MFHKRTKTLVLALVLLFVASACSDSPGQKVSGTIAHVDATEGTITLMTADGTTRELQASQKLLASLTSGDSVEVEVEGNTAKVVHKKGP